MLLILFLAAAYGSDDGALVPRSRFNLALPRVNVVIVDGGRSYGRSSSFLVFLFFFVVLCLSFCIPPLCVTAVFLSLLLLNPPPPSSFFAHPEHPLALLLPGDHCFCPVAAK